MANIFAYAQISSGNMKNADEINENGNSTKIG